MNSFEIDDDVYFCDCGFMGDKISVTNELPGEGSTISTYQVCSFSYFI